VKAVDKGLGNNSDLCIFDFSNGITVIVFLSVLASFHILPALTH
jgi:hypothetical protein